MSTKPDYYELLGVAKDADKDEIKKAYRSAANKHHPDKEGGDEEKFKEIKLAYETLSDDHKRDMYNQFGSDGPPQHQGYDPNDIFSILRRQQHQHSVAQVVVNITLEEAVTGCTKPITYKKVQQCHSCKGSGASAPDKVVACQTCNGRGQVPHPSFMGLGMICDHCNGSGKRITDTCKTCHGSGSEHIQETTNVQLPAGIPNGGTLRGQDVIIIVQIQKHDVYERVGLDLYCTITIDAITAMLGTNTEITSLTGEKYKISIPAGTQYGTKLKLANKGIIFNGQLGHIICNIKITIPTNLTQVQIKLLETF